MSTNRQQTQLLSFCKQNVRKSELSFKKTYAIFSSQTPSHSEKPDTSGQIPISTNEKIMTRQQEAEIWIIAFNPTVL